MPFFDSKVSKFLLDDLGGTQRDLSAFITEVRGLPGARLLNEVTALGDSGARFIPGLEDVVISLAGIFDDTATSGPDAVLGPLRTHTSAVDFEYGPEGSTTGDVKYSGTCWLAQYDLRSRVGSLVEWTASLQVEGAVARGAFA
ncbi:MAG: hypothetical protein IIB16_05505 [Chloroflexi bacterium]|nr:hypothetical protein [Chloroflexota bacterium]MCH9040138.1 hypothetical protein [Chloroflexota bacterium]